MGGRHSVDLCRAIACWNSCMAMLLTVGSSYSRTALASYSGRAVVDFDSSRNLVCSECLYLMSVSICLVLRCTFASL